MLLFARQTDAQKHEQRTRMSGGPPWGYGETKAELLGRRSTHLRSLLSNLVETL